MHWDCLLKYKPLVPSDHPAHRATRRLFVSRPPALGRINHCLYFSHCYVMRHNPTCRHIGKATLNPVNDVEFTLDISDNSFACQKRLTAARIMRESP